MNPTKIYEEKIRKSRKNRDIKDYKGNLFQIMVQQAIIMNLID